MRELPPAVAQGAENLSVAVVAGVILEQPDIGRRLGTDGIIDPQDAVVPRLLERVDELGIVLPLTGWIDGIRQGEEIHHRRASTVDPARWNPVAGEWRTRERILDRDHHAGR